MKTITIASLRAEPGSKTHGFLEVVRRGDGSPVGLPLTILNGVDEGPTLVADACHHGDEYEGAEVILKMVQTLNPKKLKGAFIGVHAINVPGFLARTRGNPEDWDPGHMDFNRVYPGRSDGSMTERIVHTYFSEIVPKADCVISFHGGGDTWYCGPLAVYDSASGSEAGKKSIEYASATGIELMLEEPPGNPISGALLKTALKRSIPTITVELGGHCDRYQNREKLVNTGIMAITNVMKHLRMIEGRPELSRKQVAVEVAGFIHCSKGGLQFPKVKTLDRVKKGDIITMIVNPWTGEEVERITAPHDGIITLILAQPMAKPGDWIVGVGRITKDITN